MWLYPSGTGKKDFNIEVLKDMDSEDLKEVEEVAETGNLNMEKEALEIEKEDSNTEGVRLSFLSSES